MPTLSQVHIDAALASLAVALANDPQSFLLARACRVVAVPNYSDKFYVFGRAYGARRSAMGTDARAAASARRPAARATEIDYTLSTEPFVANEYSLAQLVPDQVIANADRPLRPVINSAAQLVSSLRIDAESVLARVIADPDNYPATHKTTLTTGGTGTSWLSYASANTDPLEDLRTGKEVLRKYLQTEPNTLLLSAYAAAVLADAPAIKDIVKYTDPTYLTGSGLPKRLRGLDVVIGDAVFDSAAEGGAASLDYVFVDANLSNACAIICHVPKTSELLFPGSFLCFQVTSLTEGQAAPLNPGLSVRAYRDEPRKGWVVEASLPFDVRPALQDASDLITGAYAIFSATV